MLAEQHILMCEGCRLELELVRAIGSQEKAPAVGKDDWTLDRIFGAEGGQGNVPAPAPTQAEASGSKSVFPETSPAPDPEPEPEKPVPAKSEAAPTAANGAESSTAEAAASWDFEPADAKPGVKPPAESLFFATEALTRRKDSDEKRSSRFRVILWGAGGLLGAALLAFSSWFVLHMKSPDPNDPPAETHSNPSVGAPDESPSQDSPEQPKPGTVVPPSNGIGAPDPDAPDNTAHRAPIAREPGVSASSAVPQPMPLTAKPQATKPAPPTATNPRVATNTPKPLATAPPPSEAAEQARPKPKPYIPPPDDGPSADEIKARDKATAVPRLPSQTSRYSEEKPKPPEEMPSAQEAPKPEPALDAPAPSKETPKALPRRSDSMWRTDKPKAGSTSTPADKAPSVDINAPIDRLHLATVEAGERGDMVALRKLRTSWKSYMVKIVGPDRARAKREYADCLWMIQNLTGRRSDQRETLAAYRDYLLSAPAGGADSRSVSRLRQLEDALTEHN
jgi:hypothetical protein